ncbi:hypothetical protein IWW38_004723, partial [Coemansia aciculifera]
MSYPYEYALPQNHHSCLAEILPPPLPAANFVRSLRWSPDGTQLAAATDSGGVEIHDLSRVVDGYYNQQQQQQESTPPPNASTTVQSIGTLPVLSFAWYPHMAASAPETCCLVESTRDHPLHLRDTLGGHVRASYRAMSPVDALMTATAVEFTSGGAQEFVAGFASCLALFDVMRPGLPVVLRQTSPSRKSRDGIKGVVSCIAPRRGDLAACATFSGSLGLVASNSLDPVAAWKVPVEYAGAGVTELRWSGDHVLWAAQR